MKKILKVEAFKLGHRRETYIILLLLLLAFVLPIGFKIAPSSYSLDYTFGDGRLPRIAYIVLGYAFWDTLGVFILLFSILSVSLSSREIETHYFYLYFPRVEKRSQVYISKYLVLIVFALLWYLIYTLALNPLGHTLMCSFRPDMAIDVFSDGSHFYWWCMWLLNLVELIFYISLVAYVGMKLKPLAAISVIMIFFYFSLFFYDFPVICYVLPEHYKQLAATSEDLLGTSQLYLFVIAYVIISMIYSMVFLALGKKEISKISA